MFCLKLKLIELEFINNMSKNILNNKSEIPILKLIMSNIKIVM